MRDASQLLNLSRAMIRLIGVLAISITLAIGLAAAIGRAIPAVPTDLDGCTLPCYAGITPGVTDRGTARDLLARLTDSRGTQPLIDSEQWVYSNATTQILLTTVAGRVTRLDVDSIQQPALITLGEVLRRLGTPTTTAALEGADGGHILLLNYAMGGYGMYFLFRAGEVASPGLRADSIKIYPLPNSANANANDAPLIPADRSHPWRGFGTRTLRPLG